MVIPSRRFASVARDQGIPAFEESMREWERQSVLAPPRPTPAVVQEVARPAPVVVEDVRDVEGGE